MEAFMHLQSSGLQPPAPRVSQTRHSSAAPRLRATAAVLAAGGLVSAGLLPAVHQVQHGRRRLVKRVTGDDVQWLPQEASLESEGEVQIPLLLVEDVYLPGAPVALPVADMSTKKLYDSLLAAGGRYLGAVLYNKEQNQTAAYATLLYLEDLVESRQGYLALHFAVGRARLRRCLPVDDFLRAEADLLWDESEEALNCADALSEELSELERLQQQHGSQGDGLRSALILEPPLPPPVQAVQGLWRAKSGVRIRIHGMEVQDLGKLEVQSNSQLAVQLGSKPFSATLMCGADETVDVLTWDDGDVWRRLAAPPPTRTSRSAASIWQAARRWRTLGTWRAEARRGEARWSSATELAKSRKARVWDPQSDDQSGATAWASAAEKADSAARAELWEEVLRPCQRLLQAPSTSARVEVFRDMLRAEITRLQLNLALGS